MQPPAPLNQTARQEMREALDAWGQGNRSAAAAGFASAAEAAQAAGDLEAASSALFAMALLDPADAGRRTAAVLTALTAADPHWAGEVLSAAGSALAAGGRPAPARRYLEAALERLDAGGPGYCTALCELGDVLLGSGEVEAARDRFAAASAVAETAAPALTAGVLVRLAAAEARLDHHHEAANIAVRARAMAADPSQLPQAAHLLLAAARTVAASGDTSSAKPWLQMAAEDLRSAGDLEGALAARLTLTTLLRLEGRQDEAIAEGVRALEVLRLAGDSQHAAELLADLSSVAVAAGDPLAASGFLHECLEIARESGDAGGEHAALLGLAEVAVAQQRWRTALAYAEEVAGGTADAVLVRTACELLCEISDRSRSGGAPGLAVQALESAAAGYASIGAEPMAGAVRGEAQALRRRQAATSDGVVGDALQIAKAVSGDTA
jgi:tetratricopeptide (TPR) repeat protein